MRIRDGATGGLTGSRPLGPTGRAAGPAASGTGREDDQVVLTGRGAEVQKARALALRSPEVRESLVRDLGERIQRGEYRVSGAEVLPRLLREHRFGVGG